jgi:predicted nucleic acid-binding protein
MPADTVVVDASALAALLFGEPRGPEVADRLEGQVLFAPTLLRYELASVCLKKGAAEPAKGETLLAALRLFPSLNVREVQVPSDALVELAKATGLTAYDAAYFWLSQELGADLVSLDARLNAATKKGV